MEAIAFDLDPHQAIQLTSFLEAMVVADVAGGLSSVTSVISYFEPSGRAAPGRHFGIIYQLIVLALTLMMPDGKYSLLDKASRQYTFVSGCMRHALISNIS